MIDYIFVKGKFLIGAILMSNMAVVILKLGEPIDMFYIRSISF